MSMLLMVPYNIPVKSMKIGILVLVGQVRTESIEVLSVCQVTQSVTH